MGEGSGRGQWEEPADSGGSGEWEEGEGSGRRGQAVGRVGQWEGKSVISEP